MEQTDTNTYELLYMANSTDEKAFPLLVAYYSPAIRRLVRQILYRFRRYAHYEEDLFQESLILLCQAVELYRESSGGFEKFAMLIIKRRIHALLRHYSRQCRDEAMTVSLDARCSETENIYEVLPQVHRLAEPDYHLHYALAQEDLAAQAAVMSARERDVLACMQEMCTYAQAAERLSISVTAYDYRVQQVRRKIRRILAGEEDKEPV